MLFKAKHNFGSLSMVVLLLDSGLCTVAKTGN